MTPEEFEAKMKEILKGEDSETEHQNADYLMCNVLMTLGYEDGVTIFLKSTRWYA